MACDTSVNVSVYCQVPPMSARLGSVPALQPKSTTAASVVAPRRGSGREAGVRPMLYRRDGPSAVKPPCSEPDADRRAEPSTVRADDHGRDTHAHRFPPVAVGPRADRGPQEPTRAGADRPPEDSFQLALHGPNRL